MKLSVAIIVLLLALVASVSAAPVRRLSLQTRAKSAVRELEQINQQLAQHKDKTLKQIKLDDPDLVARAESTQAELKSLWIDSKAEIEAEVGIIGQSPPSLGAYSGMALATATRFTTFGTSTVNGDAFALSGLSSDPFTHTFGQTYLSGWSGATAANTALSALVNYWYQPWASLAGCDYVYSSGTINGKTLYPGVHCFTEFISGHSWQYPTVTFDAQGSTSAIFVIKPWFGVMSILSMTTVLTNGASSCNIYYAPMYQAWIAGTLRGHLLSWDTVSLTQSSTVTGRVYSYGGIDKTGGASTIDTGVTVGSLACITGSYLSCGAALYLSNGWCVSCPAGTAKSVTSTATSCDTCSANTYAAAGASTCTACTTGYATAAGSSSCGSSCATGYYLSSGVCTTCPAGRFQAASPSTVTVCSTCATGYSSTAGSSTCSTCAAGYYLVSSTCTACPLGKFQSSSSSSVTVCTDCAVNTYADTTGSSTCSACTTGSTAVAGSSTCTTTVSTCGVGYYLSSGTCSQCPAGRYQASLASTVTICTQCGVNTYAAAGASTCTACTTGYATAAGSGSCSSSCTYGYYLSSSVCTQCPVGRYQANSPSTVTVCNACSQNTYAASTGTSACSSCSTGSESWSGSASCSLCAAGYYLASGYCTQCAGGSYQAFSKSSRTVCTQCTAGTYAEAGATACSACATGLTSGNGASSCYSAVTCNSGYYVNSGVCSACAAGKYKSGTSTVATCTSCSVGTYSLEAAGSCSACATGYWSSKSGQSWCSTCAAGYAYSVADTVVSCTVCAAGRAGGGGTGTCWMCKPGFYAASSGLSACLTCATATGWASTSCP